MLGSRSQNKLCHIMENIEDFGFRTPDAVRLKQEIRRWYYGGRDGGEADKLVKQFDSLFSGNMFLDAVGGLLWSLVDESPLEPDALLSGAMSAIPRRQIDGRSVRAYGAAGGGTRAQYQFKKWKDDADSRVTDALEQIDRHLQLERSWRKNNRISLPSAAVSLAGIVSLAMGGWFLLPHAHTLLRTRSLYDTVIGFPSSWTWSPGTSLVFLALLAFAVGNLLFLLRRMITTLCAGLVWTLYHKGRYLLRRKRLSQLRKAMWRGGFGGYCEKLQTAAGQLADLPADAPRNRDPSRGLLGQAGANKVFSELSLKPLSGGWSGKGFYKKVEICHVRSRMWIAILCAALVILRDLLLDGPIMAWLQGLI